MFFYWVIDVQTELCQFGTTANYRQFKTQLEREHGRAIITGIAIELDEPIATALARFITLSMEVYRYNEGWWELSVGVAVYLYELLKSIINNYYEDRHNEPGWVTLVAHSYIIAEEDFTSLLNNLAQGISDAALAVGRPSTGGPES